MTEHVTQSSTGSRGTSTAQLADSDHLTDTERYRLLASGRRRTALSVLAHRTTPVALEELAVAVASREADVDATDPDAVARVRVSLHHNHLPRMDDLDVVDYDPASNLVE